ncbi:MAG TPA: hypothetical protein VGL53_20605 [Bryobacteraceae bacterium]
MKVSMAGHSVDEWTANVHFPSCKLDGASSTRRLIGPIDLRRGDRIEIECIPGAPERAPLDYVELISVQP